MTDTIKAFLEADAKRTQGEWFWSIRTLRSELPTDNGEDTFKTDVLTVTSDKSINSTQDDADFIIAASTLAPAIRTMLADIEMVREVLRMSKKEMLTQAKLALYKNYLSESRHKYNVDGVAALCTKALSALDKYKGGV